MYDCLIAGAGPAGAFAAARLAQSGWSVALCDIKSFSDAAHSAGWLNAQAGALLERIGAGQNGVATHPVQSVTFHKSDFSKSTTCDFGDVVGHFVDPKAFDAALIQNAVHAGAAHERADALEAVCPNEETIQMRLPGGRSLDGRVLIAADGCPSEVSTALGFPRLAAHGSVVCVQASISTGSKASRGTKINAGDVHVVLGLGNGRAFGYVYPRPSSTLVGLSWPDDGSDVREAFKAFRSGSAEAGLIPQTARIRNVVSFAISPGGALDLESHVAKRSLVIGAAGGFLAAVSNEAIHPGLWSADLAADVVHEALEKGQVQDGLARFDTLWRTTMADYLRMPNTDIRFLWPLVFSNQQMADKMAAAFLTGQNI